LLPAGNVLRKKGVRSMSRKNGAQVVITRKDKKLNKTGHLLAFMLTGGASSVYTATKAATNAGYDARTRELQRRSENPAPARLTATDRLQLRIAANDQARAELGIPAGLPYRKLSRDQKRALSARTNELLGAMY